MFLMCKYHKDLLVIDIHIYLPEYKQFSKISRYISDGWMDGTFSQSVSVTVRMTVHVPSQPFPWQPHPWTGAYVLVAVQKKLRHFRRAGREGWREREREPKRWSDGGEAENRANER